MEIGGWRGEYNWRIVLFSSCIHTRGLGIERKSTSNVMAPFPPFPFLPGSLFLFPYQESMCSSELKRSQVS